jgi:membrane fusion protein (multidrug efflux system)
MIKRMVFMLIALAVILGGIFGFEAFRSAMIKKFLAAGGNPPQTVSAATAGYQDWQPALSAVGSLRAVNGADLSVEVAGIVEELDFQSGDDVPAGALLLKLRAEDDIAHLHALQATAELARITYDRDQKQLKVNAVSQAQVDSDAANLKNALAQVDQQQAVVNKKIVRAPFAGHIGIRAVDLGQYVNAGTALVTLQAIDPIYLDFTLPQQALAQIKVGQPVIAKVDVWPADSFAGTISAINPKVDATTRNLQLRATLRNPDHKLLPGMYATLSIEVGDKQRFITLPQTAIAYNPYGSTVFLVEDKGKDAAGNAQLLAHQSFVTTGATRGDQIAVLKGVNEGDMVVTAGQIKLHNGSPLKINNAVTPSDDPNPTPAEQ